ncbi:helical bundle domain-containing protein [Legionella hackeliae]|nr:helical bundle domain-containing protein [Legionella hackeliae]
MTERYLNALRQNDYLQALQWIDSLVQHYSVSEGDADTILQLVIFELVQHGLSSTDIAHVELLYVFLDEQLPPFTGKVGYNATVFCNAVMQYMVFEENELLHFYKTDKLLDAKGVKEWMQREHVEFDSAKNANLLMEKYIALNNSASKVKKEAQLIRSKINYILDSQSLIKEYLTKLITLQNSEEFTSVRLGLINSLYSFLMDKTILTDDVVETLVTFVERIQKMEPYPWEKDILRKLVPKKEISLISSLFDQSAGKFQFFVVKVISAMLSTTGDEKTSPQSSNTPKQ